MQITNEIVKIVVGCMNGAKDNTLAVGQIIMHQHLKGSRLPEDYCRGDHNSKLLMDQLVELGYFEKSDSMGYKLTTMGYDAYYA